MLMLLFKPEHVARILAGGKTQTRRIWAKRRAKPGSTHLAKTNMISKDFFARLEILDVRKEMLGQISESDAAHEGYPSRLAFLIAFANINFKRNSPFKNEDDLIELNNKVGFMKKEVYVVSFRVIP